MCPKNAARNTARIKYGLTSNSTWAHFSVAMLPTNAQVTLVVMCGNEINL